MVIFVCLECICIVFPNITQKTQESDVGRARDSHHLLGRLSKMRSRQSPPHGMFVFEFPN